MNLEFLNYSSDIRGIILFCKYGHLSINFLETKKGFLRGGHYHEFPTTHFLIKGKVLFKTLDIKSNYEQNKEYFAPCEIPVLSYMPHLLTALEDCIFIEFFDREYSAIEYPLYRKLIDHQIQNK